MKLKALKDMSWRSEVNCRVIDHCKAGDSCEMSDELGQQFIDVDKAELWTKKPAVKEIKIVAPVQEVKAKVRKRLRK